MVLIDGETLAQLMIDHNVGVSTITTYELKKIDTDYFTEEQTDSNQQMLATASPSETWLTLTQQRKHLCRWCHM